MHVWLFICMWIFPCLDICSPASQVAESGMTIMVAVGLTFHTLHGVLKARILKWFAISFSSGPHSVWRKLSPEELMLFNCGVGEDSWESLGQQEDPISPSKGKSVLNIPWKDRCSNWSSKTLATWCKELTHWKRPWCWERLKAGGEGVDREWDGYGITDSMDMILSKL